MCVCAKRPRTVSSGALGFIGGKLPHPYANLILRKTKRESPTVRFRHPSAFPLGEGGPRPVGSYFRPQGGTPFCAKGANIVFVCGRKTMLPYGK